MTDLEEVLARLGLSQYLGRLSEEGFEKWEAVMDITEQDLAFLNFKLGHRRLLQREIASARGVPPTQALTSVHNYPSDDIEPEDRSSPKPFKQDSGKGIAPTGKRKYRRHPKPDEHAPEKPPSAYVMFANRVRDELKGQNLSFTDIAKLVGEKWKVLDPENKESYEHEASIAKEKYNSELLEYKKTDSYKEYIQYLSDFKSKASKEGREGSGKIHETSDLSAAAHSPTEQAEANRKRPKLESVSTTSAMGSTITSNSVSMAAGINATAPPVLALGRGSGPTGSGTATSSDQSAYTSPSSHDSGTQSMTPSTSRAYPVSPVRRSRSPSDVARYRDAVLRSTQQQQQEAFVAPTTEPESPFFTRIHPTIQSPHIQQQSSFMRHQPPPLGAQPISRTGPPMPSPAMRRASLRSDETLPPTPASMSSGSSSAPSLTPSVSSSFDDGGRSHRALPSLPPPTPGPSAGTGYFDQKSHRPSAPPTRSPRTYQQSLPPPPTPASISPFHGHQAASSHASSTPGQLGSENMNTSVGASAGGINPSPPQSKPPSQL
ncbi:unnamed protein product [Tuber melanosporum]|uniref:(Perigord truffle) hypothetical protein n=1 Tax=Tuber melanosporum (strain Mel28) TaxID=656061 RepID=D5GPQ4_TUBMM|nr:uncharacterized protein GSTUM_00011974001 [Tuber melanosporum]CAZ86497.1 unnamed protein product [Tuber melanosporum]